MNLSTPLPNDNPRRIIGESAPLLAVLTPSRAGGTDKGDLILITGETGVGKDVNAQAIQKIAHVKIDPSKPSTAARFTKISFKVNSLGMKKSAFHEGRSSQRPKNLWCV